MDFLTNAALWKKVSDHPNIMQIYFVENINSLPYIGLEYCPSVNLDQLVTSGSLFSERRYIWNLALLNKIILNLSNALAYAHSMSVYHLNIRPQNILWSVQDLLESKLFQVVNPFSNGGFIITDFGSQLIFEMRSQNYKCSPA